MPIRGFGDFRDELRIQDGCILKDEPQQYKRKYIQYQIGGRDRIGPLPENEFAGGEQQLQHQHAVDVRQVTAEHFLIQHRNHFLDAAVQRIVESQQLAVLVDEDDELVFFQCSIIVVAVDGIR